MKTFLFIAGAAFAVPAAVLALACGALATAARSPSPASSLTGVPEPYRPWIDRASRECGKPALSPALLAAQLYQESGFRTDAVSDRGAAGPAQFMPATWATWGRDDDHDGVASPHAIGDAVMAQGRLMCSLLTEAENSGFPSDPRALALAGYNAGWGAVAAARGIPPFPETKNYVDDILSNLDRFQPSSHPFEVAGSGDGPDAVRRAVTQIGLPYSYGGGTPAGPTTGFCADNNGYAEGHCAATTTVGWDCSALTQYAYWPTSQLPRTAADQYTATAHHPITRTELRPGDLLFWTHGGESGIYHVAIYVGEGQMVTAPKTGDVVKIAPTGTMPDADYVGATRL